MRSWSCISCIRLLLACLPALGGCFGKIAPIEEDVTFRSGRLPGGGTTTSSGECQAAIARIAFGFEAGNEGWWHAEADGTAGPDQDGHGVDPWARGNASVGTACHDGACFGTALMDNYRECQAGHLVSPPLDLSACAGQDVVLLFEHAYSFATGGTAGADWYDGGFVEVSADGHTWSQAAADGYTGTLAPRENGGATTCGLPTHLAGQSAFVGEQTATTTARITIPREMVGPSTYVRFTMVSGRARVETANWDETRYLTTAYWGWRIDDVRLEPQ